MEKAWPEGIEEHLIEQSVAVYLVFRGGEWVIDWTCFGEGLDTVFVGGARIEACECDDKVACRAAAAEADKAVLPSGEELLVMLAEGLAEYSRSAERRRTPGVPTSLGQHPVTGQPLWEA